jgi:uncharacterized protein YaiI (UPF0178 family)
MKIWVDADACPAVIKDILYRAANRAQVELTLIANQMLRTPPRRGSVRYRCPRDSTLPTAASRRKRSPATW